MKAVSFCLFGLGICLKLLTHAADQGGAGRLDPIFPRDSVPKALLRHLSPRQNGIRHLAGDFSAWGTRSNLLGVAELRADGSFAKLLGSPGGLPASQGRILTIAPAGWDRAWIGGDLTSIGTRNVGGYACFSFTGELLSEVSTDSLPVGSVVYSIVPLDDGCILAGSFTNSAAGLMGVARLDLQGSLVPGFKAFLGGASEVRVRCAQRLGSDRLLIGGLFDSINGVAITNIGCIRLDGSVAPSPANALAPDGEVLAMAADGQGRVYVAGDFGALNGVAISAPLVRLRADASLDSGFALGGQEPDFQFDGSINTIGIQGTGRVILGGDFEVESTNTIRNIARFHTDGRLDHGFGSGSSDAGPDGEVMSLVIEPDGSVIMVGDFQKVDGIEKPYLARLTPDLNQAPSARILEPAPYSALPPDGPLEVRVEALDADGSIEGVEVWDLLSGLRLATMESYPYVATVQVSIATPMLLEARAIDGFGAVSVSSSVPISPSVLGYIKILPQTSVIELVLSGTANWSYELQSREELSTGVWKTIERVDFDPSTPKTWIIPIQSTTQQYFRAITAP